MGLEAREVEVTVKKELLDQRAVQLNWWLAAVALFLTFFGIIIPVVSYISYERFNEIVSNAKSTTEKAQAAATVAESVAVNARKLVDDAKMEFGTAKEQFRASVEGSKRLEALIATAQRISIEAMRTVDRATVSSHRISTVTEAATRAAKQVARDGAMQAVNYHEARLIQIVDNLHIEREAIHKLTLLLNDDLLAKVFYSLGKSSYNENQVDVALQFLELAIQANIDFAAAYHTMGKVLVDGGKLEAAIEQYSHAIRSDGNFAGAYLDRGILQLRLKKRSSGLNDLRMAIDIGRRVGDSDTVAKATVLLTFEN